MDGELLQYLEVPARYRFALIARLKIMADLDIAEHRKPQDGKIDFARFGGPHIELRLVTVPTTHGLEDVVLRLLSGLKPMPLDSIGLSTGNLALLRSAMRTRVHELVSHRASASELQTAALAGGMLTLRQDGIEKALVGHTDMTEVLAASNS